MFAGEGNYASDGESINPCRAIVVPRARRAGSSAKVAIDQLVAPLLRPNTTGLIVITAPPGGGKTTALAHLRAVLPVDCPVKFFDEDRAGDALRCASHCLAILAAQTVDPSWAAPKVFELCPWTEDDFMEYLAAVHRDRCASVLLRISKDSTFARLKGSPQLVTLVLDQMAKDLSLTFAIEILRRFISSLIPDGSKRDLLIDLWASPLSLNDPPPHSEMSPDLTAQQQYWWRHEIIQRILTAEWLADQLANGKLHDLLQHMATAILLPELASATIIRPAAIAFLQQLIVNEPLNACVPMAASILLRVDPSWRPISGNGLYLSGAKLQPAQWAGIDLQNTQLIGTDFTEADLSDSNLSFTIAGTARLARAKMRGCRVDQAKFPGANFSSTDLSEIVGEAVDFFQADLSDADLTSAQLNRALLDEANLGNACLRRAALCFADLEHAIVDQADFTGANLFEAQLHEVKMCDAIWTGASFCNAKLQKCDLEGLEMPGADFTGADLSESLLTATNIRAGKFAGAILRNTGLADIDWQDADLHDADFAHASFHLGSTRSGLVGSTIPSEGSRTGFYTDEYYEQDFKSPEEIRKACLCGTDLRGAKVEDADFYLVDLRRAQYTQAQAPHFARCGAILVTRRA